MDFLKKYLSEKIWLEMINNKKIKEKEVQEIRLRIGKPIFIKMNQKRIFLEKTKVTAQDMAEVVAKISQYSLYAFSEQLGQGYITLSGGHRVGFCGKAVFLNGQVESLREISSINIRIAKQAKDCAREWLPYLFEKEQLCHTILVSPPACGKTTFLRDMVRILSDGDDTKMGYTIGIVDERGEIAGMEHNIPQFDIGQCTDVQENCPKPQGMDFLLRSMAPDVIAVDELGSEGDYQAAIKMLKSGVIVMATIHGRNYECLAHNALAKNLMNSMDNGRIVFLSNSFGVGTVEEIRTQKGNCLYKRSVVT